MDKQTLRTLVGEAVRDADLAPAEIPAIDLYVDQITSLINEKLTESAPRYLDRVLTKTMINNYSKDGLISPIKGKKYSKEQFLQMLLVYSLKNTLSIGEINRILQSVYALDGYGEGMLSETYGRYLEIKDSQRSSAADACERMVESLSLDLNSERDFLTLILALASVSSYCKSVTQALLEAHYPEVVTDKEREEAEKAEKAEKKAEKKVEKKAEKAEKKAEKKAKKAEGEAAEGAQA